MIKNLLKNSILFASLVLGVGCAVERGLITDTGFKRTPTPLSSPTNIKGNEPRKTSEKDHPYNLERVVINGYDLYVKDNTKKKEEEADFYFIQFKDHKKIPDKKGKIIDIESEVFHIPTQVKIGNDLAKKITFSTEGEFGKRAEITRYDLRNIETGIIKETEQDTRYNIGTQKVAGNEWYVPRVEKEKREEQNTLHFYMMPFETAKEEIDANGTISIKNTNGFYRPITISRSEYEKRDIPPPQRPNTPGQAGSTTP